MDTRISSRTSVVVAIIAAVVASLLGAPATVVASDGIVEYPIPTADSHPWGIVSGPDGNLWFTEEAGNKIGRITPKGVITEYALPTADSGPRGIAAGPDGNLWFAEKDKIGRITPTGTITEYPLPAATHTRTPRSIVAGPDGNLWFTAPGPPGNSVGRITPVGTVTEFPVPPVPWSLYAGPWGITAGPDGNLWFTGHEAFGIARITPTGTVTQYGWLGRGEANGITAGPDGNVWFTTSGTVGRITPQGDITEYPSDEMISPSTGMAAGPDGNVWFTTYKGIRRVTRRGAITQYALPRATSLPGGITTGPDSNLWFTEWGGNKIGRISPKAKGTPVIVKRTCPVNVTWHMPAPTKIGSRVFTDLITTKKSSCVLRRPVVRVRLDPSIPDAKKPVFDTKITKRGKIRVITKGHEGLLVTVIVRAYPKRGFADRWTRGTWRKMWYLK